MHSKSLLIAVAAFILTTSSAQAFFNDKEMKRAGFSEAQIEAFAEARELKKQGKIDEAKEMLLKVVEVDGDKVETLRKNLSKNKEVLDLKKIKAKARAVDKTPKSIKSHYFFNYKGKVKEVKESKGEYLKEKSSKFFKDYLSKDRKILKKDNKNQIDKGEK